jgi:hypothetical protein
MVVLLGTSKDQYFSFFIQPYIHGVISLSNVKTFCYGGVLPSDIVNCLNKWRLAH